MTATGAGPALRRKGFRSASRWLAGFLTCALWIPGQARDVDQQYKAQGLGLDTCASFLDVPTEQRGLYYSWLAGYLTAYNYLVHETYSIAEYTGLTRTNEWLEKYCKEHLGNMLHEAARVFVTERYRIRLKRKPDAADVLRFQQRIPR